MKKILTILIIAFSFISCDNREDREDDYYVAKPGGQHLLCIHVENAAGENLLDPATAGNILNNEIYIDFNRKDRKGYGLEDYDYYLGLSLEDITNLDFSLICPGLKIGYLEGSPLLSFRWHGSGWYRSDGSVKWDETLLTINWGDGTSDDIKYQYDRGTATIWLNGELETVDDEWLSITIVK
jgi:hypothetical protein